MGNGFQNPEIGQRAFRIVRQRQAVALVDNPDQEYANVRALRDAENRAAREAAAFLNADIAGKFARKGL